MWSSKLGVRRLPCPVRLPLLAVGVAACAPWVLACGPSSQARLDASQDYVPVDGPVIPETGPQSLALDFSATGCRTFEPSVPRCGGIAPLTVSFTPIASEELTKFFWSFEDGTTSPERSPTHTYARPGAYAVTLVAGGGIGVGTVQRSHASYVVVSPAPVGAWCDVDSQCGELTCACGAMSSCSPVLSRGFCSEACDASAGGPAVCPDGTVCANLAAGVQATPTAPSPPPEWRRSLCLAGCLVDADCPAGFRCRDLVGVAPGTAWVRACFASYPLAIGTRCADSSGQAVDADCASGLCADVGAFGRCSANCDATPCPPDTACARFNDGRALCLARCSAANTCDDDPLLACEPAGGTAAGNFTVAPDSGGSAGTFCAPKRCATAADCGPVGSCLAGAGTCRRLPPN